MNQLSLQTFHQLDPLIKYQRGTVTSLKTKPQNLMPIRESPFEHLRTLGNTLYKWRAEVGRMLRFTKNNGITEGFHRKMKLIQ